MADNEKLFTQEEVNQIVSERLKRVKTASEPVPAQSANDSPNDAEKALTDRETAVKRKENKLSCSEYLDTLGLSKAHKTELLQSINTDDVETFKAAADRMIKAFGLNRVTHGAVVSNPPKTSEIDDTSEKLREAFKLNKR